MQLVISQKPGKAVTGQPFSASPLEEDMTKKTSKQKARAVSTEGKTKAKDTVTHRELAQNAKAINALHEKATQSQNKSDEQRLAACILTAEAAERIKKIKGLTFKQWVEDNLTQKIAVAKEMLTVGNAEKPQLALEDLRARTAARNKKSRADIKSRTTVTPRVTTGDTENTASVPRVTSSAPVQTPTSRVIDTLAAMDEADATTLLKSVVRDYGLVATPQASVKSVAPLSIAKNAFSVLSAGDKMKLAKHAAEETGGTFTTGFETTGETKTSEELLAEADKIMADAKKGAKGSRRKTA